MPSKTNLRKQKKANMKTNHSGNSGKIETLKNVIVAVINGRGDVVQAPTNTTTQTLATTIKDVDQVGTSVTDAIANVATGTVRRAARVGAEVGHAAQGI